MTEHLATQAPGTSRHAAQRLRDAVPVAIAVIAPWLLLLGGLWAFSLGLRYRQYSGDALVVIGLIAAPVIAGLTVVFHRERARVAWPIGVGAVIAGLISGAIETGIVNEACLRVPPAALFIVMFVPGALWFATTSVIVAWVAGRKGSLLRGAGALLVGAAITIPVLFLCALAATGLQNLVVDRGLQIECANIF